MRLCDIGTEEVQTFLNAKHIEGLSWWTRKALQAVVSSIFTKAEDWGSKSGAENHSRPEEAKTRKTDLD